MLLSFNRHHTPPSHGVGDEDDGNKVAPTTNSDTDDSTDIDPLA